MYVDLDQIWRTLKFADFHISFHGFSFSFFGARFAFAVEKGLQEITLAVTDINVSFSPMGVGGINPPPPGLPT